jgi:hypothetical protein
LVPGALEAAFEGSHETGVLVGDDQPHPREATAFQRGEEAAPEHLVLAVAHVEPEDLTTAVGGDAGRHHDGHRHHLRGAVAHVQIGRIEVDVREAGVVQPSRAEGGHHLVQAGADARDLRFGDAESIPSAATRSSTERVDTPAT